MQPISTPSTQIVETQQLHKSRWGYHPCDYDTYIKLKKLYKLYWQAVYAHARWKRWERKKPSNRVIRVWKYDAQSRKCGATILGPRPEPTPSSIFCETGPVVSNWGQDGKFFPCGRPSTGWVLNDYGIMEAFVRAGYPVAEPGLVKPLGISRADIEQLLARAGIP